MLVNAQVRVTRTILKRAVAELRVERLSGITKMRVNAQVYTRYKCCMEESREPKTV